MECALLLAICLVIIPLITADAFDEIEANKECDKWAQEVATYPIWKKDCKKVDSDFKGNGE